MAAEDCTPLQLEGMLGFTGSVPNGLQYLPSGQHIVYPLAAGVVVRSIATGALAFLDPQQQGSNVTCLAISSDGRYLATGHDTFGSAKAFAYIWDVQKAIENCEDGNPSAGGCLVHSLQQHRGMVQALDFSCEGNLLVTVGGQDDNDLVVWDVETGKGICGSPASNSNDKLYSVKWLNNRNDRFVTCGQNQHFRVWEVCTSTPKLHAIDASMGSMRREMHCISISSDDAFAFVGTTTGEVLKFSIDRDDIKPYNEPDSQQPSLKHYNRKRFSKGVQSVACVVNPMTGNTNIIAGAGDGIVQILNPRLEPIPSHRVQLSGAVTSLSLSPDSKSFHAGTDMSQRYSIDISTFTAELRATCHYGPINDVKFPANCSDIFATASVHDIRVWNVKQRRELLRIQVPNLTCNAIDIAPSGTTITSAWSDGKIRAFYPESGKLKFMIPDAHTDEVTALTVVASDDDLGAEWRMVSGGKDGQVRVWKVLADTQQLLIHSVKEHSGPINSVVCNSDGTQVISSSEDGSCIVWDLNKGIRIHALFDQTIFHSALYHPDQSQYLTCGANYKLGYWDAYDGTGIRMIEGGEAEITCIDIQPSPLSSSPSGLESPTSPEWYVSGSADKSVKVWHYDDGITVRVGWGHSGTVNCVTISPDEKYIVSAGQDGGIFIWRR
mmetsp:Transcript_1209/g.2585  ORF Transcript_1209/g.2585 Transcript_1209/m.2585 type:complete len:664 (+) Transcript_1209:173-2164(+)